MAQAAVAGLGLVLLPEFLFSREIEDGALVPAIDLPTQSIESYFLSWPLDGSDYAPMLAFRDWVLGEMHGDRA